jgi:nucleoside-diphosphate-sugar epimerase
MSCVKIVEIDILAATRMKTISLLGSGWLGLALNRHYQKQSVQVKTSTRTQKKINQLKEAGTIPYLVDIEDQSADIQDFLDCDVLIVNITSKNISSYVELIFNMEASKVRHVLFVSSSSVYKNINDVVKESDGVENINSPLYQIEKLFMDNPHFQTTVVRMAGLIGPARHPGRFFRKGKGVEQPKSPVNLIHQTDCVNIISQIIEQKVWDETFNACASTHPTKQDFYGQAKQCLGEPVANFIETNKSEFKIVCNQKVRQFLNYEFIYDDLMSLVTSSEQSAFEA